MPAPCHAQAGSDAMITLDTPVEEYLALCEERGANPDGDCPSFAWVRSQFPEGASMGEALDALLASPAAMESAMFAFENMLDVLSPAVRERFARIICADPSHVVHALNWRRLAAAHDAGAAAPTEEEDWLLRGAWHSKWQRVSLLPDEEALI